MFKRKKRFADSTLLRKPAGTGGGWQRYQRQTRLHDKKRRLYRRIPRYCIALILLAALIHGGFHVLEKWVHAENPEKVASIYPPGVEPLSFAEMKSILDPALFLNPAENTVAVMNDQAAYRFNTSIDADLQKAITASLDTRHANRIGIVALDADSGRVLAMVSHDRDDPGRNACLAADIPAASIFKIITAAAALEKAGFEIESQIPFNGRKTTLYRNQLTATENRYTNYTSLKAAFAESINPVFGKLGKHELGRDVLEKYARMFYFNRAIDFELPVDESRFSISDTPYNWAEIGSGFNRDTTISPLHAAMIAASVSNGGRLMKPTIVNVATRENQTVYLRKKETLSRVFEPVTADSLKSIMNATLHQGTARRQFTNIGSHPVLSVLDMGGKTGSINNNARQIRFDWFAGFAADPSGSRSIAIGILVAHKEYIGKRAATYFREAVSHYFRGITEPGRNVRRNEHVSQNNIQSPA